MTLVTGSSPDSSQSRQIKKILIKDKIPLIQKAAEEDIAFYKLIAEDVVMSLNLKGSQ